MTAHVFLCEAIAFVIYLVYCSFFEWTFHRWLFHTPKFGYYTFRQHTLVHHQIYGAGESYHSHEDHPPKVTMDWWALLAFLGFNAPVFWLIQRATHFPSFWAGMIAVTLYYTLYESFHWAMHVPKASRFLEKFRVYRFLDTHHHIHHKYMLSNLNVIWPLADLVMGTLRDGEGKRVGWHLRQKEARMVATLKDEPQPVGAAMTAGNTAACETPIHG